MKARLETRAHTAKEFERWVAHCEPGDVCEYHRGKSLSVEDSRGNISGKSRRVETAGMAWNLGPAILRAEANRASIAYGLGVVDLVQRKNGPGDFSYLAIRRKPKVRA